MVIIPQSAVRKGSQIFGDVLLRIKLLGSSLFQENMVSPKENLGEKLADLQI